MNRLKIDIKRINPFVFEKFQKRKIAELTAKGSMKKSNKDLTPKTEIK